MGPSSTVWLCPACGRHVPLRHHTCHCGATRPASLLPPTPRRATPPGGLGGAAALLLLVGVAALFYYGWPRRWYEAWAARVSLVTPTPAPSYPDVPDAGPEPAEPRPAGRRADLERPLPPAVGEPAAPPPSPANRESEPPPRPSARTVATAVGPGVPAQVDTRVHGVDEPGPLEAAERRAVTGLTPRLVALDRLAEKVGDPMRRYVRSCRRERLGALPVASRARRDWPVPLLLDPAIAPSRDERSNADTGCLALWAEVRGQSDELGAALDDMHRFARANGLLPGHVRDALAEHRLDGWERYPGR